jgi:hypothetical protein
MKPLCRPAKQRREDGMVSAAQKKEISYVGVGFRLIALACMNEQTSLYILCESSEPIEKLLITGFSLTTTIRDSKIFQQQD